MEKGYGFGAEGDWKVAAMVRLMKIMTAGKKDAKGTSMLEDYTYNLVKGKEGILEAHMLEICPTIADGPDQHQVPAPVHGRQRRSCKTGIYFQGGSWYRYFPDRSWAIVSV